MKLLRVLWEVKTSILSAGPWIQVGCAIYLKSFKSTRKKPRDNRREMIQDHGTAEAGWKFAGKTQFH